MLKSISFHPKLAAVVDLVVNLVMLGLVARLSSWWMIWIWLGVRIAIWVVFMWSVYYSKEMSRVKHLLSLSVMLVGACLFLLFVEWKFAWYIIGAAFSFFSFFSFWLLPSSSVGLSVFLKPHLRWRFVMSTIGLAGIFQGVQAIISLQIAPGINSFTWLVVAAVCASIFAGWWWWEYSPVLGRRFWLSVSLWFVIMLELLWVINMLPLGYLTSSLVLIWCWYVAWLLFRFNLSQEGIHWKKQVMFLSVNSFLFTIFLFFIALWK
jgi:hypothetical protein